MKAKKIRFIGVVSAILCTSLAFLAVLLSTMSVVRAASCPDNVLRVKKGASGAADGCSWDDAYPELQLALSSAESGDQIWVASGVYTPGLMVTDSFEIPPAVQVYGGFAGIEDALEQRNWQANKTVFSGDIGGDDIVDEDGVVVTATHIVGDNSYHVLFLDGTSTPITETTILDGVIVTAGYAHGDSWYETRGGGMLCYGTGENSDCSPTLMNVLFSGNQTSNVGGAMYNDGSYSGNSDPSLTHVIFSQNYAEFDGGAMYNAGHDQGNSSPVLSDVVFIRNWAYFDGGAVYNTGRFDGISNPSFISVTFDSNVGYYGGALVNGNRSDS